MIAAITEKGIELRARTRKIVEAPVNKYASRRRAGGMTVTPARANHGAVRQICAILRSRSVSFPDCSFALMIRMGSSSAMGLLPGFGNGNDTRVCYPRQPPAHEGREFALGSGVLVILSA